MLTVIKKSTSLIQQAGIRYTSGFKYYQILKEPQPSDITSFEGGIRVIPLPKQTLTEVEESRNPEEWKFVENLLPKVTVPEPPKHQVYPTPSGWFPPKDFSNKEKYKVKRTRFHNFPIYHYVFNGGNRKFTVITKITGDIKALDEDIKIYLYNKTKQPIFTTVNEVCCKLWIRGSHITDVAKFCEQKGF